MRKRISAFCLLFFTVTVNSSNAQFQNVLIDQFASETTIAIDPQNTNLQVAGSNLTNYYYSSDAGATWTNSTLSSTWEIMGIRMLSMMAPGTGIIFTYQIKSIELFARVQTHFLLYGVPVRIQEILLRHFFRITSGHMPIGPIMLFILHGRNTISIHNNCLRIPATSISRHLTIWD